MITSESTSIRSMAIHKVGNKINDEGLSLSKSLIQINNQISSLLLHYFLSPFKSEEYFHFSHESNLEYNEVYNFVCNIFDEPNSLLEESVNIAKHLYENSEHPKIKSGELYIVYFSEVIAEDEVVDAIGIFKSELKETYLKIYQRNSGFEVGSEDGININKLDKGCLIFNIEREKGFVVSVTDNLSRVGEARFWTDGFLQVEQRRDDYFKTQNVIEMCKSFVTDQLPEQFEVSRADQADLLNKSVKYLKEEEAFNFDDFAEKVIEQPEVIDSFKQFKSKYEEELELDPVQDFNISQNLVKKQARVFKSVIKLDKNFHVYVHGNRQYIVRGYDNERGMNYYQLFFEQEK